MKKLVLMAAALMLFALPVYADGYDLTYKSIDELTEDTSAAASADFLPRFNASGDEWVKVGADDLNANFGITATATELNIMDGVTSTTAELNILDTVTATATEINVLDIVTPGTGAASKAVVLDSGDDYTWPATGVLTYGGAALAFAPLINPGRDSFTICGEATTINNNTVYYGPDVGTLLPNAGNGQTCDINAVGNTTEATADAPAYTGKAFQVLGMTCRNEADANAAISFTLRTAAGATVPSVTCSIADGDRDCVADVQTTTAIASAATVAVAAASSGDIADANGFVCTVAVAY